MRQNFTVGQEIISQDLNKISSRSEKLLLDKIITSMLRGKSNAFFEDSFKVIYISSTSCSVSAGVGIQNNTTETYEPANKPLILDVAKVVNFDIPDATSPRIDIICTKALVIDDETEIRKFKDENTDEISEQSMVVSKKWQADIIIVKGVAGPAPSAPAVPAGYILVSSHHMAAATGMAGQESITDNRVIMPLAGIPNSTMNREYDAVIGNTDLYGYTHETLKEALDSLPSGSKILVTRGETIDVGAIPEVVNDDIEIVFKPGITFVKGTADKGLKITGDRCRINGGRFYNFSVGGDVALHVQAGAEWAQIIGTRFNKCATQITDDSTEGATILATITEA